MRCVWGCWRDRDSRLEQFELESQSLAARLSQDRANFQGIVAAERSSMLEAVEKERLAGASLTAAAALRSEKLDELEEKLKNREAELTRKEDVFRDKVQIALLERDGSVPFFLLQLSINYNPSSMSGAMRM